MVCIRIITYYILLISYKIWLVKVVNCIDTKMNYDEKTSIIDKII